MWLALYLIGLFTQLFLLFFWLKNLETDKTTKRIKKPKEEIIKCVKESILIDEIANQYIENKVKSVKNSEKWRNEMKWKK